MIDRREALRRMGMGALSLALPGALLDCAGTTGGKSLHGPVLTPFDRLSPLDRFKAYEPRFNGDAFPDPLQKWLLNKAALLGRATSEVEEADVVIVGGGMSGILSAYQLRDLKPVLLDKELRMGGNSRGEAWEGVEYPLGAASLRVGQRGEPLLREVGALEICHSRASDPVLLDHKVYADIWGGQTDPAAAKQFTRLRDFFLDCLEGRSTMAQVPDEKGGPLLADTDAHDFLAFLVKRLGEPLHPHVHTLLELECWARLGASMQEVSAAVALPHCVHELGPMLVAPGGNAVIAERFLRRFVDTAGIDRARAGCTVLDVRVDGDHAVVSYLRSGSLRRIRARAVVMACPKFIAARLIDGYASGREEALGRMGYRAYVVGNACLDRAPQRSFHDLILMGDGEIPFGETRRNVHDHGSAAASFANFAQVAKPRTVITICHPLPFPTGREELGLPDSYETYSALLRKELFENILPPLGYYNQDLKELRLTRWGQPIPFAKPGFYAAGSPEILSKPFGDRVFFVNQDTWAAPAFETCAAEATKWAARVRGVLG